MTTAVRLMTVAEIAQVYGRRPGTIHVLAHRKKWRRIKHGGLVYYDLDDVDRDLGKDG